MKVGELFVNLGIKGLDQVSKGLGGVGQKMSELGSMSLATKATILGVVYGLERMAAFAAGRGMAMKNFADYTGLSVETLQRWQIAAKTSGISADEMTQSITNVQNVMGKMKAGLGAPSGWADISRTVGLDFTRVDDTFYVMGKLKEYAQKTKLPTTLANQYIESFVGNQKVVGFLRTTKTELDKIPKGLMMTSAELERQARLQVQWELLWTRMQNAVQRFAMIYAPTVMKAFERTFSVIETAVNLVGKLAKAFPEVKVAAVAAGIAIAYALAPVTTVLTGIGFLIDQWQKKQKGEATFFDFFKDEEIPTDPKKREDMALDYQKRIRGSMKGLVSNIGEWWNERTSRIANIVHNPPMGAGAGGGQVSNNVGSINLNFQHDGKDAQKVSKSVQEAVNHAFYSRPAAAGGGR